MSFEGDCGTCGCSEDSGISGALFSSKVEAVRISICVLLTLSSTAKTRDEKTSYCGIFLPCMILHVKEFDREFTALADRHD